MQPTLPEVSYLRMTLSDAGVTSHLLGTEADFAYGSSIYKARPGKPAWGGVLACVIPALKWTKVTRQHIRNPRILEPQ